VSQLCSMIQDSIRSGRYPLETETQKRFAGMLQVTIKSDNDDLKAASIEVESRIQDFFVINNYVSNIRHLPGVIELDVLDSFKMMCRKIDRLDSGMQIGRG
jgi:hypothetical protein